MSAPGSKDDEAGTADAAAGQALPADAGVAAGGDAPAPPDAQTRVTRVPPPPAGAGAAAGDAADTARQPAGHGDEAVGAGQRPAGHGDEAVGAGERPAGHGDQAVGAGQRPAGHGDQQAAPQKASTGGPSGSAMGSPGGLPAGLLEKLPIDQELLDQRPEILVGGAFVAGFLLARILRAIGSR